MIKMVLNNINDQWYIINYYIINVKCYKIKYIVYIYIIT